MSSFPAVLINAFLAAGNLGWGIYNILQPEFNPAIVALNFGVALFISLLTLSVIASLNR